MGADASLPCGPAVHLPFCKLCPPFSSPSNRDPHMELREEAWSPGPLDSEDQQMASHENPGEVGLGSCQRTPSPSPDPGSLRLPSGGSEIPSFPPEALASAPARPSPVLGGVKFSSSCTSLGANFSLSLVKGVPSFLSLMAWSLFPQCPGHLTPFLVGLSILPDGKLFRPGWQLQILAGPGMCQGGDEQRHVGNDRAEERLWVGCGGDAGCLRIYGKSFTLNIGDVYKALLGLIKLVPPWKLRSLFPGAFTRHLRNKVWTFFHVAVDASSCRASCWPWVHKCSFL